MTKPRRVNLPRPSPAYTTTRQRQHDPENLKSLVAEGVAGESQRKKHCHEDTTKGKGEPNTEAAFDILLSDERPHLLPSSRPPERGNQALIVKFRGCLAKGLTHASELLPTKALGTNPRG
jgi:hypothetical protein